MENRLGLSQSFALDNGPWFSVFHPGSPEYLDYGTRSGNATIRFRGNESGIIQQEIDQAVDAGIAYWLWNHYADDAKGSIGRMQFIQESNKKGLKGAYMIGGLNPDDSNFQQRVDALWADMQQDWYMRINGKPLIAFFMNWPSREQGDSEYERARASTAAFRQKGGVYAILLNWYPDSKSKRAVTSGHFDAYSSYVVGGGGGQAPFSAQMSASWGWLDDAERLGVTYAPNITVGFDERARRWSMGYDPGNFGTQMPTAQELDTYLKGVAERLEHSAIAETIIVYSWNEYTEGGVTVSPQKHRDGTIRDFALKKMKKYIRGFE